MREFILWDYSSLDGPDRRRNLQCFLANYHSTLASALAGAGSQPDFDLQQLTQEYRNRNMFGLICSFIDAPNMIMNSEDVPDLGAVTDEKMQEFLDEQKRKSAETLQNNPLLRSRFLDTIDDTTVGIIFD